jgi:hypothetical protein
MRIKPISILLRCALVSTCVAFSILSSCTTAKFLLHGGERAKKQIRPDQPGPYVLIFAGPATTS